MPFSFYSLAYYTYYSISQTPLCRKEEGLERENLAWKDEGIESKEWN
jgi:hypothetical protein